MNWLTPACSFIAASAFFMAFRIHRLDSRSLLNRLLVTVCVMGGIYELGESLLFAVTTDFWFWPTLYATSTVYLALSPFVIAVLAEFAGAPKSRKYALIAPSAIFALVQLWQLWTGTWVVSGYHGSEWGNVLEFSGPSFSRTTSQLSSDVNLVCGLTALGYAWNHSRSRRYRRILLVILAISIIVNLWGLFATVVMCLDWGLPDLSCLGAGIDMLGYAILVERYQYLTEQKPDLTGPLLASLSGTAVFADRHGVIVKAPEESARFFGKNIEGRSLTEILDGWPNIGENWELMEKSLQPQTGIPGMIRSGKYRLHLFPHRNPFEEFDGALVRVTPENALEETQVTYDFSSREYDVAELVCAGYDTQQIAEALFISAATVKNHLHNLYIKTGTSGRAELVRTLLTLNSGKID